jgi:hypothetical protein
MALALYVAVSTGQWDAFHHPTPSEKRFLEVLCDQPEVGVSFGKQPGTEPGFYEARDGHIRVILHHSGFVLEHFSAFNRLS